MASSDGLPRFLFTLLFSQSIWLVKSGISCRLTIHTFQLLKLFQRWYDFKKTAVKLEQHSVLFLYLANTLNVRGFFVSGSFCHRLHQLLGTPNTAALPKTLLTACFYYPVDKLWYHRSGKVSFFLSEIMQQLESFWILIILLVARQNGW